MTHQDFDLASFWRDRLSAPSSNLAVVGHRALGSGYNALLYQRREEVLLGVLQRVAPEPSRIRVLDVGCGTGYWTEFWRRHGVQGLVGVDLSRTQVTALRRRFPQFRFEVTDATKEWPSSIGGQRFDVVTLFDVLYHIVDDTDAARALQSICDVLTASGALLIFDQIVKRDTTLLAHVKYRGRSGFESLLAKAGLTIVEEVPLFVLMVPPVYDVYWVNVLLHGTYWIVALPMRWWPALGHRVGRVMTKLDHRLLARGVQTPNHSLFVVTRKSVLS